MQYPTLSSLAEVVIYKLQRNQSLISLSVVIKCLRIQELCIAKTIIRTYRRSNSNTSRSPWVLQNIVGRFFPGTVSFYLTTLALPQYFLHHSIVNNLISNSVIM